MSCLLYIAGLLFIFNNEWGWGLVLWGVGAALDKLDEIRKEL